MSDSAFFDALDLDHPGLEHVKDRISERDLEGAKAAFVIHLKERATPRFFRDWREKPESGIRPKDTETGRADQALSRTYTVAGQALTFEETIDWTANPTDPFDPEWTWQFGRFSWWHSLGKAYWDTGDEKYAKHFVWELQSWIHANPCPEKVMNGIGSRWRTIECGIRLSGSWPHAFYFFLSSPHFTDDDVVLMIKSMAEQADYLHRFPTKGNWLTMEANGMGHVGILFPEFQRAKAWRDDAIERLYAELEEQVYPDGLQKELSTGYHYVALRNFLGLAELCLHNDLEIPSDYIEKLQRMWEAGMWAMMPDRTLPHVNDAWHVDVPGTLSQALKYFPEREDFRWVATEGKEGKPPHRLSCFFPWSGWAVMRSGWGREDVYLFFDVGPFGMGHQHEDKLAFLIQGYGKDLLVDVGSYKYEQSPMRSYVLSARAHNTVFVDGEGQYRRGLRELYVNDKPQDNPWITEETYDFCEGVYDHGFGTRRDPTITQVRSILFVKPSYWLVLDRFHVADEQEHEFEALFHLGTEDAQARDNYARTLGDDANLHLLILGPNEISSEIVKGQEEPYYLGWKGIHNLGNRVPMPVARFSWQTKCSHHALYLLYPTRPGQELPVRDFRSLDSGPKISAEILFDDGTIHKLRVEEERWSLETGHGAGIDFRSASHGGER